MGERAFFWRSVSNWVGVVGWGMIADWHSGVKRIKKEELVFFNATQTQLKPSV